MQVENGYPDWTRGKVESLLLSGDTEKVLDTLLSIAFYDTDWRWVQDICLRLIDTHTDENVRELAITCIGHVARIHGRIDKEKVLSKFDTLIKNEPQLLGRIDDALGDVRMFVK